MIAMLIRKTSDGNVYEFIERQNIWYIGKLLADEQISNLKRFNNTVIAYKMLKQLGKQKLLDEIEALTGIKCIIKIHEHEDGNSVIVWRKPVYVLDVTDNGDKYVLTITNYGDEPVEVKTYLRFIRDGEGKVVGYVTQKEVKQMLKADGYTAVKFKEFN